MHILDYNVEQSQLDIVQEDICEPAPNVYLTAEF